MSHSGCASGRLGGGPFYFVPVSSARSFLPVPVSGSAANQRVGSLPVRNKLFHHSMRLFYFCEQ